MTDELPYWLKVVSAVGPLITASATLFVGVVVAVIARRQWRTAHEKVILDLFDRRMKIYEAFRETMTDYNQGDGDLVGSQIRFRLQRLWSEARFLFGNEVPDFIREINLATARKDVLVRRLNGHEVRDEEDDKEYMALEKKISEASMNLATLLHPYVLMDQKRK